MTMPRLLNRTVEKQITDDWRREIPSLGIYKPRHLLRRVGPLLVGICLERDSGGRKYKPKFHVHFLGQESVAVFLTLYVQLRAEPSGGPDFVEVRWHETQYKEAAARMVRQSPLSLDGDLQLEQVINVYQMRLGVPSGEWPILLYRDMILLSAWAHDQPGALKFLAKSLQLSDDDEFRHVGDRATFEAECQRLIAKPALIQQIVEAQLAALHAGILPISNLLR